MAGSIKNCIMFICIVEISLQSKQFACHIDVCIRETKQELKKKIHNNCNC